MGRPAKPQQPVTLERLEVYLDWLAGIMVDYGPEFECCLPIYERLEREINDRKMSIDKMTLIKQRVRQSRDPKASLPSC
jgi:hypothetical protein